MNTYKDAPNSLNDECFNIELSLSIKDDIGEICWNIPENFKHYNGYLILLDNQPISSIPLNQHFYNPDNTVDRNKHLGDKLDTALIIGAFYNDTTTHHLTITDLKSSENYYIAGYGVNNVRDYANPNYSYQLPLTTNNKTNDTNGYQIIKLGILPDDPININNKLQIFIDNKEYNLNIEATNYEELINNINLGILQADNIHIGTLPNNANGFIFKNNQLYQFDGYKENLLECHIGEFAPNHINDGDYWISDNLYRWENGKWNIIKTFDYKKSIDKLSCGDYWFDGEYGYVNDGHIWKKCDTYFEDISKIKELPCNSIWFDGSKFYQYNKEKCQVSWNNLKVFNSEVNPLNYTSGYYWLKDNKIYQLINKEWKLADINMGKKPNAYEGCFWYNVKENAIYGYLDNNWKKLSIIILTIDYDITIPNDWLWFNGEKLYIWDKINNEWKNIEYIFEDNDPSRIIVKTGDLYFHDDILDMWDGSGWKSVDYFKWNCEPFLNDGDVFHNVINNSYWIYNGTTLWTMIQGCSLSYDKSIIEVGQYWYNPKNNSLVFWNGINWQSLWYSKESLMPKMNEYWYNVESKKLYKFIGKWEETLPKAYCEIVNGDIKFISTTYGSKSSININPYIGTDYNLFYYTSPRGLYNEPVMGTDGISDLPLYKQLDVGFDGSFDERRNCIDNIMRMLGHPVVSVELDKSQLELCVDLALSSYRKLAGNAYKRRIFFMELKNGIQNYYMTDKTVGFNTIVGISAIHRRNYAYLSTPGGVGNGAFSQQFLQYMYSPTAGLDLVSYQAVAEYSELMEKMFATRIIHRFDEHTRRLDIMQNICMDEKVILDTMCERSENDLLMDRYASRWILEWAVAEACLILAQIRGKYSSVPSANGSTSLNAGDLSSRANDIFEKCKYEIDNYIADNPEIYGAESFIMFG